MTAEPRPPLPRWVWITAGALVAVVIAGVIIFQAQQHPTAASSHATPAPSRSASPSSSGDTSSPGVVSGCLAEGQSLDMVLATQKKAPHTPEGAVEVATALMRWAARWPAPSVDEYQAVTDAMWVESKPFNRDDYNTQVAGKNLTGGIVPDNTDYYLTPTLGFWAVNEYSRDTATVSIALTYNISRAVSPVYKAANGFQMVWTDHGWKATRIAVPTQDFADGKTDHNPYVGGGC
jgi:hypothetical protein